jgi:hypothetical protein
MCIKWAINVVSGVKRTAFTEARVLRKIRVFGRKRKEAI